VDAHSRYLLRCQALSRTDDDRVWPVVVAAFREFGLPKALRSDNGPPFASRGVGGLSKLSVKVIKAGVMPERIAPGKPQQNGRRERLHLTLLQDTQNRRRAPCASSWSVSRTSSVSTMKSARTGARQRYAR
jgi:putative transposase